MFKNILVPIDGSEPSDAAIKLALRLASEEGAKVTFAHVIGVTKIIAMTSPTVDPSYAIDAARIAAKDVLEAAKGEAAGSHAIVSSELLEGECVATLLEFAKQCKIDLIIVGSHGRSGIPRALLGSVSEGILRRSDIPVLVTHAPRKRESKVKSAQLSRL